LDGDGRISFMVRRSFSQAKVDDFGVSNFVALQPDHDVAGFDIAMDQALLLDGVESAGH
jgi:hypothetical protein